MSLTGCERVIRTGTLLLLWAGLILLGGVASLLLLHYLAPSIPAGPYHDLYGTLVVFVAWPVLTLVLRFSVRLRLWDLLGLWP
jgi:hypothetical protein